MERCTECGKPFGLIRWRYYFASFCTNKCRELFKLKAERRKAYLKWLYPYP
jgi:hypothetical protein